MGSPDCISADDGAPTLDVLIAQGKKFGLPQTDDELQLMIGEIIPASLRTQNGRLDYADDAHEFDEHLAEVRTAAMAMLAGEKTEIPVESLRKVLNKLGILDESVAA